MKKTSTLRNILVYGKKYSPLIVLSLLLSILVVASSLYIPILIGKAIDCIVDKGVVDFDSIKILLLQTAITVGIGAISQWLASIINNKVTFNIVRDIRIDAFNKITTLPLSYVDTNPVGKVVSRVISDVEVFADGLLLGFTQMFTGILTIIGVLAIMFTINYVIALIVLVLTPLSIFMANFISKRTYKMFNLQSSSRAEQTAYIDEILANQKVVKAFNYEDDAVEEFSKTNEKLEKHSLKAIFFSSLTNPSTRFINNIIYALVVLIGALIVMSGNLAVGGAISVGILTSLLVYTNQYTKPFNEITGVITEFQNALVCANRIFELIKEPSEIEDLQDALVLGKANGNVKMEGVYFSYEPNKKLIENLNIDIKPGAKVAIVGPTGCGKTTLINLLMRFYDVTDGSVLVDNNDIKYITRKSLRQNYGMVLQDTFLKSGTVRENIVMGKEEATEEEIIEACKKAKSYSFIKRLPQGLDTIIGENGGNLSQGQKQLLCITRVMLTLPPMLILDEATSSIDVRTEMQIQDAFNTMMKGRTSFIVAHRLSTIKSADLILVMKDGNIVEQGNHQSLLDKKGFYAELYNSQYE